MALPSIPNNINISINGTNDNGVLQKFYGPLINLKKDIYEDDFSYDESDLGPLTINALKANIHTKKSIDINIEEAYDGSANLIINDKENSIKLINSRFYLTGENTYKIADRKGSVDTNIYNSNDFSSEASLTKIVQSVIGVKFDGIFDGGNMPIGNYTFYFKLADSDGNESDFIAESGKVVCHIGGVNQPKYIRGGQVNENSGKLIKFTLTNLDLAYHYINVYYTRSTGIEDGEVTIAKKINTSIKINGLNTSFTITGYEQTTELDIPDINIKYASFHSAKTVENCQNMTFVGNTSNDYELFKLLERYSLYIYPSISREKTIGNLNALYEEIGSPSNGYEYYNANNIYYNLGYWDEEIYRLGIVYILNDYSLSPVFNIRGIKELKEGSNDFKITFDRSGDPSKLSDEHGIISESNSTNPTNIKGVFKIIGKNGTFNKDDSIKPIGIKINFPTGMFTDKLNPITKYTKGYFIVRQKRIPTILAQAVGISTTKHGNLPTVIVNNETNKKNNRYLIDSFLRTNETDEKLYKPALGNTLLNIKEDDVKNNALLCPEASLRTNVYNNYFNSSEFLLKEFKYQPEDKYFKREKSKHHYSLNNLKYSTSLREGGANILLVEPEIELIGNHSEKFSSKAGDAVVPYKYIDVLHGDYNNPANKINNIDVYNRSISKVRGVFNTYLGADNNGISQATYYNIFEKGYNFERNWLDYFKLRSDDTSPYFPISDRIVWKRNITTKQESPTLYRGDCYINTFTQRMQWNFIDPDMPSNNQIIDKYTWFKNFKITNAATSIIDNNNKKEELNYYKMLPLFTYKFKDVIDRFKDDKKDDIPEDSIIDSESKAFKKYSDYNGTFGYEKMNRPDINAVELGYWVTFKVCSNVNLAMRDIDRSRPMEEAVHHLPRSFYPLQPMEKNIKLPESRILNPGISKPTSDRYYYNVGSAPFIKDSFPTRIYYSNILQQASFSNGNRVFISTNFRDYSLEYGSIVKLVEWYGSLISVMEHGVLLIPVNERALASNAMGENVYINTDNVLPQNPRVLSNTFGSVWSDSIVKTNQYVYGVDTVGKKIWRTNGQQFDIISDLKIQSFLNDNINIPELNKESAVLTKFVKTHYNAFKHDIMFTLSYNNKIWNLCWNELQNKWVTRYTWFPIFSENINNIFYTFANKLHHRKAKNYLYKHGFAGGTEEQGKIYPTRWYDEQHPFEFEFIVNDVQGIQKIYDNLKIVSNKVEPNSFIFEIVGDGYDWHDQKEDIIDINNEIESSDNIEHKGFNNPFEIPL